MAADTQTRTDPSWRWAVALLPLLLALPFDPQWPDFERARRGVLLVLAGLALGASGLRRAPRHALAWLGFLAITALASALWAANGLAALERGSYLLALATLVLALPLHDATRPALVRGVALALLLTSVYGCLQCLGWLWPQHYTVAHEPVSSLGNRNVAAEWTALAAPLALSAPAALGWPALGTAAVYLWANGGRAGLLAFHLGVLVSLVLRRDRAAAMLVPLLAAAGLGGWLLRPQPPAPTPDATIAAPPPSSTGDATLEVRLRIWRGTLHLANDHLPLGIGAGNFAAAFPPYRDPREIAVSSFGHRFGSRVTTPHNDVLEIGVELAGIGLLAIVGFLASLKRQWRAGTLDATALATLAASLPVVLLRSPLGNAPAAFAAVAAVGLPGSAILLGGRWRAASRFVGLPLLALGLSLVAGETFGADFLRAKRVGDAPAGLAAIDRAIALDPLEPDWRLLRAQVPYKRGQPVAAARLPQVVADLDAVLARRPHDTTALLCLSDLGLQHALLGERGRLAAEHLLRLDPGHPLARLHAANYAFLASDWPKGGEILLQLTDRATLETALELVRGFRSQAQQVGNAQVVVELARLAVRLQQRAKNQ